MTEDNKKKVELLLPAGGLDTLVTAVQYGADAVYIGGQRFGLRAKADNFSLEDMKQGIKYAHENGVKVYLTVNIFAHNDDIKAVGTYFDEIRDIGLDAVLISDPGLFMLAKEHMPEMELHVSTQANNTNYETFKFWYKMGAKRVVCARELSLKEIAEIRQNIPEDLEIEAFMHGAMCISYSGRCLLSSYLAGRDANRGLCTHPCRWKYAVVERSNGQLIENNNEKQDVEFAVVEENRPGEYMPIEEDERGTYIFNSKDLCMIEHIPEMIEAGIYSFKIEGRMKTKLYVASTARTYREAIDDYLESEELYRSKIEHYKEEIAACTFRQFTTGFYFGKPDQDTQIYDSNTYIRNYIYLGAIEEICPDGRVVVFQKNKFLVGDEIEIMDFRKGDIAAKVVKIEDENGREMESAPHPKQKLYLTLSCGEVTLSEGMLLRMKDAEMTE
ncbi:MAG: U32 family peptidase C-terminal domain-containing protein [Eubacterium sp.]|nr:U32 family peptidase C-terminal domain-containing protein [Eubacterium sp.]